MNAAAATVAARRGSLRQRLSSMREDFAATRQDLFPQDRLWRQRFVREVYNSRSVQLAVAGLVVVNFLISAVEAQVRPESGSVAASVFFVFEVFFAVAFTVELVWNMYGSFLLFFWLGPNGAWNAFDFVVVMISLLSIIFSDLPGISVLRLFRAFRAFRLFKRVTTLKAIIEGVLASLPGVANAFIVLLMLMGVWAIIGVEFFGHHLDQEFGTFFKALFTMWQMMTMDSWASGIARILIFDHDLPLASLYFVSYTFVAGIVMTNVVVTILLEKYLDKTKEIEERMAKLAKEESVPPELVGRKTVIDAIQRTLNRKRLGRLHVDDIEQLAECLVGGGSGESPEVKRMQRALRLGLLTAGAQGRRSFPLVRFVTGG